MRFMVWHYPSYTLKWSNKLENVFANSKAEKLEIHFTPNSDIYIALLLAKAGAPAIQGWYLHWQRIGEINCNSL